MPLMYLDVSYFWKFAFSSLLGFCRGEYKLSAVLKIWLYCSTLAKVRYFDLYFALTKVKVGVPGAYSPGLVELAMLPRPDHVPNRLNAMMVDQRCAAQNGQYSAPR